VAGRLHPRSSAAAPRETPSGRNWPDGRPLAGVPATHAGSGATAAPCLDPHGLPVAFALASANAVDQEVLVDLLAVEPRQAAARSGQLLVADKNTTVARSRPLLASWGVRLLRPARKGELPQPGARLFKPLRQLIESVNASFKG